MAMNSSMELYESSSSSSSVIESASSLITEQEQYSSSSASSSLPPLCDSQASMMSPPQDDFDSSSIMPHRHHRNYSIKQSHQLHNTHKIMTKSTILLTILTLTLSTTLTTASSTISTTHNDNQRHLDFNSYWNGEWQAGDENYECQDCDDAQLYNQDNQRPSDMWVDDNIQQYKTEEYLIIRNVSIALVALLCFSCCMCYPECLILSLGALWRKVNCCCPVKDEVDGVEGGGYVGGRMEGEGRKKKKRNKQVGGGEEPTGLAVNSGVELV